MALPALTPLFTVNPPSSVPRSHLAYECMWYVLFALAVLFTSRRAGELRRLVCAMLYGTAVEVAVYFGLEAIKFQGVGRQYDHGKFTLMLFGNQSPFYMDLCWWPVVLYVCDLASRKLYGTRGFWERYLIGATLAVVADYAVEPVAINHGFWVYRTSAMGFVHWAGSPLANNIAWFGIEGGFLFGSWVSDRVAPKGGLAASVVQVPFSLVGMLVFCLGMTAFRAPYGFVTFLDDHFQFAVLLFVHLALLFVYLGRRAQHRSADKAELAFPAVIIALWQLSSLAFRWSDCNNKYRELCTRQGFATVAAVGAAAVGLFVLPLFCHNSQAKQQSPVPGARKPKAN